MKNRPVRSPCGRFRDDRLARPHTGIRHKMERGKRETSLDRAQRQPCPCRTFVIVATIGLASIRCISGLLYRWHEPYLRSGRLPRRPLVYYIIAGIDNGRKVFRGRAHRAAGFASPLDRRSLIQRPSRATSYSGFQSR